MLRAGVFKDERTAEEQVVQVLNFDIHLVKDFRGVRYIERITECIPVEEKNEYTFDHRNETTLEGKFDKFMDNAAIFFGKTTNRELYKYRNVMEYVNDDYVLTNPISETNIKEMRINMETTDMEAFDQFLERNWGIKPPKIPGRQEIQEVEESLEEPKAIPVSAKPSSSSQTRVRKPVQRTATKAVPQRPQTKRPVSTQDPTQQIQRRPENKQMPRKNPNQSSILGNIDFEDEN